MTAKTNAQRSHVTSAEDDRPFTIRDLKRFLANCNLSDDAVVMLQGADGDEIDLATAISIPEWDMMIFQMDDSEYDFDDADTVDEEEGVDVTGRVVSAEDCASCVDYENGDNENDHLDAVVA